MRVLILSCNTGGGHNSCGTAIRKACEEQGDTCELQDALQFVSGRLSRFLSWGHTTVYRHIPWLFRRGYSYAEKHPRMLSDDSPVYKLLTGGTRQLYSFLAGGGYDAVICTHVFSGLLLRQTLREYPLSLKTAFVATDYTCSPGVAKCEADVYFIPSGRLAEEFVAGGVPAHKLVASGIPVDARLYGHRDKARARKALGIHPEHTHLLMMCGSMGCGPMKKMTRLLSRRLEPDQELSVICGTNRKLQEALESLYKDRPNIHIHGYVKDMAALMDSADLYLTKPGGLSVSEAMVKRLPMVLIDAVAGCEGYNLRYFVGMGGAATAPAGPGLADLCVTLLKDAGQRDGMSEILAEQARDSGARSIRRTMYTMVKGGDL